MNECRAGALTGCRSCTVTSPGGAQWIRRCRLGDVCRSFSGILDAMCRSIRNVHFPGGGTLQIPQTEFTLHLYLIFSPQMIHAARLPPPAVFLLPTIISVRDFPFLFPAAGILTFALQTLSCFECLQFSPLDFFHSCVFSKPLWWSVG